MTKGKATAEEMILILLEQEMQEKNITHKAFYRFQRLMISPCEEAVKECAKLIGIEKTVASMPGWLGTMFMGMASGMIRDKARRDSIEIATRCFARALTEAVARIEEENAEGSQ